MPFAVVGGVVAAAGAVYAADKAGDAQDKATKAQKKTGDQAAQLGRDQLAFDTRVYDEGAGARDFALSSAQDASAAQLKGMNFAYDTAKDYYDYQKGTFRPLEQGIVSDAEGYDTAERRAQESAAAQADVDQSFQATRDATDRDLARSGVAPGSAKYMALLNDASISQAATRAGAGTMANRNVEQQGYARRMDAAALGRNLPSNQATQQQLGANAGTAAVGSAGAGVAAQMAGVPNMNAGYTGAMTGAYDAGSLYGAAAKNYGAIAGQEAAGFGALGKAVGGMTSVYGSLPSLFSSNPYGSPSVGGSPDGYWADGGPVRKEPTVGTRDPVRSGGGGGMSDDALVKALTGSKKKDKEKEGMGALPANPVTSPRAILDQRERDAGLYAVGGPVMPVGMMGMRGLMAANDPELVSPMPTVMPGRTMTIQPTPTRVDGVPMGAQPVPIMPRKAIGPPVMGGMRMAMQNGGEVDGPGGPTEDAIPAQLSDGEHVVKAATVTKIGGGNNERGQAKLTKALAAIEHAAPVKHKHRKAA